MCHTLGYANLAFFLFPSFAQPLRAAADAAMLEMGLGGGAGAAGGGGAAAGTVAAAGWLGFVAVHLRRNDMKYGTNRQHA